MEGGEWVEGKVYGPEQKLEPAPRIYIGSDSIKFLNWLRLQLHQIISFWLWLL